MIVRNLEDVVGGPGEVKAENWVSRRLLLAGDRCGFSLHDTVLYAGTSTSMWYQHHLEAVYCIAGTGRLEDRETGEIHPVGPGTLYVLNGHERHVLHADEEMRMVCVFTPPIVGDETHDENGTFPLRTLADTD